MSNTSFDVRGYRAAVKRWRKQYAGLSASIRDAKYLARNTVPSHQGDRQRTLAYLQAMANAMMQDREDMKTYWRVCNAPLPLVAIVAY